MNKAKGIVSVALLFLTTRHEFNERGIRITLCHLISFTVPFDCITGCETKTSHYRCRIASVTSEETKRRVFVRTRSGFCLVIQPPDVNAFVGDLRRHMPHVRVRALDETFRGFGAEA